MNKYLALKGEKFDISKFTIVGSPSITSDGVASGFSNNSFIKIPYEYTVNDNIKFSFKINGGTSGAPFIGFIDSTAASLFYFNKLSATRIKTVFRNTSLQNLLEREFDVPAQEAVISCNITKSSLSLFLNGIEITSVNNDFSSFIDGFNNLYSLCIGNNQGGGSQFNGSIDLSQFSITVDGQTVFTGTKPVHLLERRKEGFDLSKFTVVGSPTITDDGVASGFSGNDYLTVPIDFSRPFKIEMPFTTFDTWPGTSSHWAFPFRAETNGLYVQISSTGTLRLNAGTGAWSGNIISKDINLSLNTQYLLSLEWTGTNYIIELNGTQVHNVASTTQILSASYLIIGGYAGASDVTYSFNGSIDLKHFSITVDGQTVFTGTKPVHLLERRKEGFDLSKFTVIGSPTITEYGVASGFSTSPLNRIAQSFDINAKENITIECGVIYKDDMKGPTFAFDNSTRLFIGYQTVNLWTDVATNVIPATNYLTSMNVSNGDLLKAKLILTNNTAQVIVSVKNQIFATNIKTSNIPLNITFIYFGQHDAGVFTGSIDLPSISITVDGKEVFTGAKENYYVLRS